MRIVSLVPSITKTLCDLSLKNQIVGITNFCVDPPDLHRTARRIGGTKDPDLAVIAELNPTHLIVNQEENRREDIESLGSRFSTFVTFPKKPQDVPDMISQLGEYLGVQDVARHLSQDILTKMEQVRGIDHWRQLLGPRFLYLIWRDPWMMVGKDTYISNFLELIGFENALNGSERYPVVDLQDVLNLKVDVVLLSSEPWPFRKRDADYIRQTLGSSCPKLCWVDGKAFSWYGSTTAEALTVIAENQVKSKLIKPI